MAGRASLPNSNNCLVAASFLIYSSLFFSLSYGADTLYASQSLSGDQTLVSSGENFELGFFKPGTSSNYYIGMWFKKVMTPPTIAWVANREIPIVDRYSSELRIVDGNLMLFNESKIPVWSTNVNSTTSRSLLVVVLLDDGNLVLRDGSDSDRPVIWQSFDHPTHTWLPDGKIGYNKRTGTKQLLTSWKNSDDPAPGLFSLELDPIQRQYILRWNRSVQYWTNRDLDSLLGQRIGDNLYNFIYIANKNESYATYSLHNPSFMSRFILDVSGQVKAMTWLENTQGWNLLSVQPMSECDVYSRCGAFGTCKNGLPICDCLTGFRPRSDIDMKLGDYSGGCVRRTSLQCGDVSGANVEKHGFFTIYGLRMPPSSQQVPVRSAVECKSLCSNDCSCIACAANYHPGTYVVCKIWNDELFNIQLSKFDSTYGYHEWGRELSQTYIKLALSDIPSGKGNGRLKLGITITFLLMLSCITGYISYRKVGRRRGKFLMLCIIGYLGKFLSCIIGYLGTIIATVLYFVLVLCRISYTFYGEVSSQVRNRQESNRVNPILPSFVRERLANDAIDVPFFDFKSILAATDNFSDSNKLGKGGFGPVYKGHLAGGQEVAVKRLSNHSGQGLEEFKNEVVLIAKLQHRNLVRILGYCTEREEKIILYEFMKNKSLDTFIFDQMLGKLLDWSKRFEIIMGITRGLLYLHQDSRLRIIHRDFKTSNILLDEEMIPKISDFGLARIVGGRKTEANTNRVAGTYGYMSPEYVFHGDFSIKSDVFSFGVVMLEIISGKRNSKFYQSEQALHLLGYAWNLWKEKKPLDLMDHTLIETFNSSEALKCIIVGLLCVQDDPSDRPTMTDVLLMLGGDIVNLPDPKQPMFVATKQLPPSYREPKTECSNGLTVSQADGR